MAEWLKATVLKTVMGRPIVSSNLTASSRRIEMNGLRPRRTSLGLGVVEGNSLENCRTVKGTVSSNLTASSRRIEMNGLRPRRTSLGLGVVEGNSLENCHGETHREFESHCFLKKD
jgi:hypothetical protein